MNGPQKTNWPSEQELADGLSHRLKTAREQRGVSQAELARRLGLSKSSITKYEAGVHMPAVPVLVRLALGLGVSTDHLVGLAPAAAALGADLELELAEPVRELAGMEPAYHGAVVQMLKGFVMLGRFYSMPRESKRT